MWVWQCADGEFAGDDQGNFMHVFVWDTRREDVNQAAKKALEQAAKSYGFGDGKAVLWAGKRPITDEQLEEQLHRESLGLVPDPFDIAAIRDRRMTLNDGK